MDWKAILALAVFAAPVAYCTADDQRARREHDAVLAKACFEAGGNWSQGWGGYCEMGSPE